MSNFKPFSVDCVLPAVFDVVVKEAHKHGWRGQENNTQPDRRCLYFLPDGGVGWAGEYYISPPHERLPLAEAIARIKVGPPNPDPMPVCRFNGVGSMRDSSIEVIAEYLAYRKDYAAWFQRQEAK